MAYNATSHRVSRSTFAIFVVAAFLVSGFFVPNAQAFVPTSSVTITSPSTGVHWGGLHDITWTDTEAAGPYKLYYSSDFSTYQNFVTNQPASPYSWDTTAVPDDSYMLKIENANGSFGISGVFIVDNTAPVVEDNSDILDVEATSGAGAVVSWTDPLANDLVDGPVAVSCDAVSGSTFPLGSTIVTCSATDVAGNIGSSSFTITVVDITAPVIAAHADENATAPTSAGVSVVYVLPVATDIVDGTVPVTCIPASGSTFPVGTNIVTCNATDSHGNAADPTTFKVIVTDNVAPTILSYTLNGSAQNVAFNPGSVSVSVTASELVNWISARIYLASNPAVYKTKLPTGDGTNTGIFTWDGSLSSGEPGSVDGIYNISVHIADLAGNDVPVTELTPYTITVDTQAPTVSVTAPVAETVYKSDPILSFTASDPAPGTAITCSYSIDGVPPTTVDCALGTATLSGLSDGRHSVKMTVADAAENSTTSPEVSFVRDIDNILTVDDTPANNPDFPTIQAAVNAATSGDTISVAEGIYTTMGQLVIGKNLTITSSDPIKPVVGPGANLPANNNVAGAWLLVNSGITLNLSNMVLDGDGWVVHQGVRSHGSTTINGVDFRNIKNAANPYVGFAVASFGGTVPGGAGSDSHGSGGASSTLTVTNSTFTQIGRIGILIKGTGSTATISSNTYTGKGIGNFLDYAFEVGAGGTATIGPNNTISGNLGVASSDGSTSAGILVTDYYGTGTSASIIGNTISDSTDAIAAGYDGTDNSIVSAHGNRLTSVVYGVNSTNPAVNAEQNWWGSATGPTHATNPGGAGVATSDYVDYSPWCTNPECTEFGSNDPLNHIDLAIVPPSVEIPNLATVTITAKDAADITRVNEAAQVSLTADGGATFGSTLLSFTNGAATTTVTNSVAGIVHVTATIVGGTQAATGQVEFTNAIEPLPTGIVVNDIVAVNTFAKIDDSYLDGWHYKFRITVNNEAETELFVKFSDWTNTASAAQTVAINGNTRLLINESNGEGGCAGCTDEQIVTGIGPLKSYGLGNEYAAQVLSAADISAIDRNSTTAGRQVEFDVFTKLPIDVVSGFYSTTYGICTDVPGGSACASLID